MFSIFIVEDELLIAEMLKHMLLDLEYSVAGLASNYEAAIEFLNGNNKPDLVLVDINLESSKSGFDLAKVIKEKFDLPFVFLTSYADNKTIKEAAAFQPEAYIVKPFKSSDLLTTIEIAKQKSKIAVDSEKYVFAKDGSNSYKIKLKEILWLKSDNIYVEIKLLDKKLLIRKSLESILEECNCDTIVRTHRSYAVNLLHLKAVNGSNLLVDNDKIPLSRMHKEQVLMRIRKDNS